MADWANLQIDIIGTVIRKLDIPDYIRFRAVCTSWNRVCACRDVSNNPRVDPWLMLPTNMLDGAKFFSIPERKNETIRILSDASLFASMWTPVGSSHGWLVFFSLIKRTIQLVNPISGAQFQLPPVRLNHFSKAVLLDMSESNFSVAVIYGNQKGYEVTRKGSKSWSSVDSKHILIDIFKHKRQLYTIDIYGTVELWAEPPRAWVDEDAPLMGPHLHHNFAPDEHGMLGGLYLDDNFAPDEEDFPPDEDPFLHDNFAQDEDGLLVDPHPHHNAAQQKFNCLVETPAGDLVKVKRQSQNKFAVWILNKGTSSFERTDDIGEFTLFVSHHSSLCLPAKDHPNLKANCVYFIDGYRNLCAFNLENETKELVEALEAPFAQNQQNMYFHGRPGEEPFLWFVPSLK
uniref:Uncharacterized protein n=1 Tax=Avena sativa TaxID=4498 RepID=A0ACD5VL75_AVESA